MRPRQDKSSEGTGHPPSRRPPPAGRFPVALAKAGPNIAHRKTRLAPAAYSPLPPSAPVKKPPLLATSVRKTAEMPPLFSAACALLCRQWQNLQHPYSQPLPHSLKNEQNITPMFPVISPLLVRSCAQERKLTTLFSCIPALFGRTTGEGVGVRTKSNGAAELAEKIVIRVAHKASRGAFAGLPLESTDQHDRAAAGLDHEDNLWWSRRADLPWR